MRHPSSPLRPLPGISRLLAAILLGAGSLPPAGVAAQDTLSLGTAHGIALSADPRYRQLALVDSATRLRLENLKSAWLPHLALAGRATYQTEIPEVSLEGADNVPGDGGSAFRVPAPEKDQYDITAEATQLVWDGGRTLRARALERARREERRAEVRSELHGLREEVNRAFFGALLEQERHAQLRIREEGVEARWRTLAARVEEGAALPSQAAELRAELLRIRQQRSEAEASRLAALRRLESLTGIGLGSGDLLVVPELDGAVDRWREWWDGGGREGQDLPPELARIARARERALEQAESVRGEDAPELRAFVRGGYGRPGLDFLDQDFGAHARLGVEGRWPVFDQGATDRRAEAARVEATILSTREAALEERLGREAVEILHVIARLESLLPVDDTIVGLQEVVVAVASARLDEGASLPSEYVEARTRLFEARLQRRLHRIQLARARAGLLVLLGAEIPPPGPAALIQEVPEPAGPDILRSLDLPSPTRDPSGGER